MTAPGRSDDDSPDAPADDMPPGASGGDDDYGDYADAGDDDRALWYSWERWKYIGGTLFLILGLSSVGYVLWDIIDLLPKPVTLELIRAALRESPGRITDMLALSGMISFGPPAGVDLMFGATQAAKNWARRERKKGIAIGQERGIAIGEERGIAIGERRGRSQLLEDLRARANGNPAVHKLLDEVDGDREEK